MIKTTLNKVKASIQILLIIKKSKSENFAPPNVLANYESPIMVKSSGNSALQGVDFRVSNMLPQVRTNREAFDIAYGSREAWYNDKRFQINDVNFDKMEKYFLGQFETNISNFLKKDNNAPISHIEDYQQSKNTQPQSVSLGPTPQIYAEQLNNIKYYGYGTDRPRVTVSDPMAQMSPWKKSAYPK